MRKQSVIVVCALFALTVGVAAATADGGGNSANAHACQKGGWMNLQGSDGTKFANQDQCVSFGAHGGTIVPIPPSISASVTANANPRFCNLSATLSHFAPNTQYQVEGFLVVGSSRFPEGSRSVTTDSSGAGSVLLFSFLKQPVSALVAVGNVSSPLVPFSC